MTGNWVLCGTLVALPASYLVWGVILLINVVVVIVLLLRAHRRATKHIAYLEEEMEDLVGQSTPEAVWATAGTGRAEPSQFPDSSSPPVQQTSSEENPVVPSLFNSPSAERSTMPYTAEISRSNPTCFLFLVDQSASMSKPFAGHLGKSKAQAVADAINRLLQNLVLKCTKSEGIRDYFHVGVIGYGAKTGPAFGAALAGQQLAPISEIANKLLGLEERLIKIDDGAGGVLEQKVRFPVWFEPKAEGNTPMCQALTLAAEVVSGFLGRFPGCYPPLVINITDGMATDGMPEPIAARLRSLAGSDGNVLLFNAHLSSREAPAIEFPDTEAGLTDDYARIMFRMSSRLPARIQNAARNEGLRVNDATRGFVFNADLVCVIRFMDIGTKVQQTVR
jgi:hypothetical protein